MSYTFFMGYVNTITIGTHHWTSMVLQLHGSWELTIRGTHCSMHMHAHFNHGHSSFPPADSHVPWHQPVYSECLLPFIISCTMLYFGILRCNTQTHSQWSYPLIIMNLPVSCAYGRDQKERPMLCTKAENSFKAWSCYENSCMVTENDGQKDFCNFSAALSSFPPLYKVKLAIII